MKTTRKLELDYQSEMNAVPEERLWESLAYFLDRVVPVAEKAKVKLAMHPDDPPLSPIRGIGRIMRSVDGFQRLLDMAESEYNGLTLCQGNFSLMMEKRKPPGNPAAWVIPGGGRREAD